MYRGTTPELTFTLPFSAEIIDNAYVSFSQYGAIKIDKALTDCRADGEKLIVRLTQAETLSLKSETDVEIQISIRIGDNVMRSQIIRVQVERILKNGAIE